MRTKRAVVDPVVALGDSYSCGAGVGVGVAVAHTWVGVLSAARGCPLHLLATAGSTVADVRAAQLPAASNAPHGVATVLAGLNDVFRAGFDPAAVERDLVAITAQLTRRHRRVLLVRLHDHADLLPIPGRLRAALSERIAAVNAAVDAAAADPRAVVLDLAGIAVLRRREAWAVDRLHPSLLGHHAIAMAASAALTGAQRVGRIPPPPPVVIPSRAQEMRWVVRHGSPWMVKRAHKVGAPIAAMIIRSDARHAPVSAAP